MSEPEFFVWMLAGVVVAASVFLAVAAWKHFRRNYPDRKFQVRITDLWALILGLAPGMYLTMNIMPVEARPLGFSMLVGQVVAAFVMQLVNEGNGDNSKTESWISASHILAAAILGLLMPLFAIPVLVLLLKLSASKVVNLTSNGFEQDLDTEKGPPPRFSLLHWLNRKK